MREGHTQRGRGKLTEVQWDWQQYHGGVRNGEVKKEQRGQWFWARKGWVGQLRFNETNVERFENAMGRAVIASVGLRVSSISNKDTFEGTCTNFSIRWDVMKNKCACTNFMKVRKVGLMTIEGFEWSMIV